ncbi:bifunctional glycosyltransferase family 2/GtrA family protein [Paenibacillus sp. SYP-B4298]|uniref:bifunctional glycosyltransferase family 2/GtrA family protein n=1 Tax=Paenibacillus sp. SYP-B4298 TaxID=2996034 RepID=UPI0022DD6A50|nr:bifunctional glycosyltransferase family 2/GtrA family protein [Paenibacillus sp. SYP-B4298]
MMILIPSYEPDKRLVDLVKRLKETTRARIIVVDDGSGERYQAIFNEVREAGCIVLTHRSNEGKGSALKTGIRYAQEHGSKGIVCADSDGQHLPEDITRIMLAVHRHPMAMVLGSRQFTGHVPLRSRFGNSTTRFVYKAVTGTSVQDTQTGLRGYPPELLPWLLQVPGERFEYEMNMLLEAPQAGYPIVEVPIETVYLEGNKSSHFRPLADSARIYLPFLKFCMSSGFAAMIDFILLLVLQWATGSLLAAVIGARLCSSIFNYMMNRNYVFAQGKLSAAYKSMPRYFTLVVIIMLLNYGVLSLFHEQLAVPIIIAKLLTEVLLFLFSYWAQRRFVY